MEKRKKEQLKTTAIITLILVCLGLCAVMGIQALTNAKPVEFNLGTNSTALVKVEVQMLVNGSPLKIYSSQDPASVDYNSIYVDNITNDTINLNNEKLPLTNNSVTLIFKSYHPDNKLEVYVNQTLKTTLAKGSATTPQTSSNITVSNIPESPLLGSNLISIRFIPLPNHTVTYIDSLHNSSQEIVFSEKDVIAFPTEPTDDVLYFGGWYLDAACTQKVPYSTIIMGDMTLYAYWAEYISNVFLYGVYGEALPYIAQLSITVYRITDQDFIAELEQKGGWAGVSLSSVGETISPLNTIAVSTSSTGDYILHKPLELNKQVTVSEGDYIAVDVAVSAKSSLPSGYGIGQSIDKTKQHGASGVYNIQDTGWGLTYDLVLKVGEIEEVRFSYGFYLFEYLV